MEASSASSSTLMDLLRMITSGFSLVTSVVSLYSLVSWMESSLDSFLTSGSASSVGWEMKLLPFLVSDLYWTHFRVILI